MNPVATYNYGETPEEVIRERFAARQAEYERGEEIVPLYIDGWPADDLLTVLDALKVAADSEQFVGQATHDDALALHAETQNARQLRIAILAALGIDESGAAAS